jgi:hypothetical protein
MFLGVVTICSMAFGACSQYVTLIIPRSVNLIGDFVFGPSGGKIVIPETPNLYNTSAHFEVAIDGE